MRHILRGLRELLPDRERQKLSDTVIADILDRHTPPGLKKKFFFLNTNAAPDLVL